MSDRPRMGSLDSDLLHRVGGQEVITLARIIVKEEESS